MCRCHSGLRAIARTACPLLAIAASIPGGGCTHEKLLEGQWNRRTYAMQYPARVWLESEQGRPYLLGRDLFYVGEMIRQDVERLDYNSRLIGHRLEFDFKRFEERMPAYEKTAEDLIRLKPEAIEPTAIILFI